MPISTVLYNIILSPITQIIEISYRIFNKMFGNTGIAILGVSLTVTLLCLPLYIVAEGWQETERNIQGRMKAGIDRIKKAFKGDEQYMILNTYYRQNHYHPIMALRSSFGILIQIPFFLAAYHTLSSLPDLMGRSFFFIRDMGKPDAIFSIAGFNVNILPIAMTVINCVSGAIYSKGHSLREKIQIYGMAAIFLVVLYDSPAGLVLYWTMNNIFSLVKNVFYKMKNPLKVLYYCLVGTVIILAAYILFIYDGGANIKKRIMAAIFLLFWIPVPFYVKGLVTLGEITFSSIFKDIKPRVYIFIVSAIGLCVLNGLVLPSQLILSSVQEFSNIEDYASPSVFLHSSFWMSFGLFVFWPTCIFFLFKERIQTLLTFFFSVLFFSAIINSFAFSGNYGSMDVTLKFIDGFSSPSMLFLILNLLFVSLILLAIVFLLKHNFKKAVANTALISASAFVVLSVWNIRKINDEYKAFAASHNQEESINAKFSLSKTEQNIVIFMLDRFESAYLSRILSDQKDLSQKLDGFVFYPNCVSFNGHTLMGSPGVYGGFDYTPLEMNRRNTVTLKEKHNQALALLPKILAQKGFISTVSDLSWANYSYVADMEGFRKSTLEKNPELNGRLNTFSLLGRYAGDFKKEKIKPGYEKASLAHVLNRNLFWTSLFREVPAVLRPVVYYKGTWWENGVKESSNDFANWYSILYYLPQLVNTDSKSPTLSILTNECTHSSEDISMYDIKPEYEYSLNNDAYKIDTVSLIQIGRFADFLRENGIYDNTRIVVVSDHGIGGDKSMYNGTPSFDGYSKDRLNPVLLVKDFYASSNGTVQADEKFMTNADVPAIVLKGIVEAPKNPFTDTPINEDYKKSGVIITKGDVFMPYHSKSEYEFTIADEDWIHIKDNIFIDSNWQKYKTKGN